MGFFWFIIVMALSTWLITVYIDAGGQEYARDERIIWTDQQYQP